MLFSSLVFLWYFLPAVFFLYFITKNLHIRNSVLLTASLFFYAWGEPKYVILMLVSIGLNYFFGLWIGRMQSKHRMRLAVTTCVFLNLLLLGYFKYFNFAVEIANSLLSRFAGGAHTLSFREIALPVGISFYTFQALSYVVDVYRGTIQAQKNIFHLALYISFFPQLIAEPIVKYHDVCEQIGNRQCTAEGMAYGIKRFSYGLAKKMLFANTFAATVDWMMEKPLAQLGTVNAWMLAVLYTLQIYFDFSGYSDMAIGLGKMFGFDFMENFNYPYISTSIREFWRRWHVTLGNWFKDYVFYPISISKFSLDLNKKARKRFGNEFGRIVSSAIPILAVWLLTGIWHGPDWKYVTWGLFHGILIMLSMIFTPYNEKLVQKLHIKTDCFSFRLFQMGRTFLLCCLGRVFFRADDFASAIGILKRACTGIGWYRLANGRIYNYGLNKANMTVVIVAMLVLLTVSILQEKMDVLEALKKQNLVFRWVLIYALLLAVVIFGMYGPGYDPSAFIYEKF